MSSLENYEMRRRDKYYYNQRCILRILFELIAKKYEMTVMTLELLSTLKAENPQTMMQSSPILHDVKVQARVREDMCTHPVRISL